MAALSGLAAYRASAEAYTSELTAAYWRRHAGLDPHAAAPAAAPELFGADAVARLRAAGAPLGLVRFAVDGSLAAGVPPQALGARDRRALYEELHEVDLAGLDAASLPPSPGALPDALPAERFEPALRATARDLGLSLDGVRLDLKPRPGKSARPFCAAVRVPGEVHLVAAPGPELEDLLDLLHETGHALHFAHLDPALPFEERAALAPHTTETFAAILERLAEDEGWLRARLGLPAARAAAVAEQARASRARAVARHAERLAQELHTGAPAGPDPLYHCAAYLRAARAAEGAADDPLAAFRATLEA